jgi:hypothetical protein
MIILTSISWSVRLLCKTCINCFFILVGRTYRLSCKLYTYTGVNSACLVYSGQVSLDVKHMLCTCIERNVYLYFKGIEAYTGTPDENIRNLLQNTEVHILNGILQWLQDTIIIFYRVHISFTTSYKLCTLHNFKT